MHRKACQDPSRREFLLRSAGAMAAVSLAGWSRAASAEELSKPPVCIFSKHLQWLDYSGMAETAAELGFDGVDLTVRPDGHVKPERVEEDLPRAVEAVRKAGLRVPMIVTAITEPDDPSTHRILKTASRLGIPYYRLGYWRYPKDRSPATALEELQAKARALAQLNQEYGIVGDYQNHTGLDRVGAAVWDLWFVFRELDPRWIGCQFDVRHATAEGGYSWPTDFRLIAERVHTIVVKDFVWQKEGDRWEARSCPLGQGMVDFPLFFTLLRNVGFHGPISVHYEYSLGGAERGAQQLSAPKQEVLSSMRNDLIRLREWLSKYGFA
ncbi:MAG: sugar phosphate isomerase/epimerase [candidate division KSB1 bacterium]|nr:sugar phosphate isomerase/epimerase [candidate division KSB1 bacterium]